MQPPQFKPGPIITCSSGMSAAVAVSVIRLSGFESIVSFKPFFAKDVTKIKPRKAQLNKILNLQNEVLDEVLLLYFPAPHSYNGENILELHVHGNPLNVRRIMRLFCQNLGVREASAGEFTYRALINKKLNLAQVEGLDLLLHAQSPLVFDQGMELLNGELGKSYEQLYELFINLKTFIELAIDFSDDVGQDEIAAKYEATLKRFEQLIENLHRRSMSSSSSLLNPQIALFGPANAGKSTLFNLLLGQNRSIVSDEAGTTRDYISETISLGDAEFKLIDTAGIRETQGKVELKGIESSYQILGTSFFKILLFDPNSKQQKLEDFLVQTDFDLVVLSHAKVESVSRYIDLIERSSIDTKVAVANLLDDQLFFYGGSIGPKVETRVGPIEPAGRKDGPIEPLADAILKAVSIKYIEKQKDFPILLERHRACLDAIHNYLKSQSIELRDFSDLAILSSKINVLGDSVEQLIGMVNADDVLNHLFSRFCIGK